MGDSSLLDRYVSGTLIGERFQIRSVLGRGSMSTVFAANDRESGASVAIKILEPAVGADPPSVERFTREARFGARLRHPNVVRILESGTTAYGDLFLVMEQIEGETLASFLQRESRRGIPFERIQEILCDVAKGLGHAHSKGVIHRDLKPENILIDLEGVTKISDFGLCRIEGFSGTASVSGECIGTPYYMAPELIRGEIADAQSDIYSFGIVAYESAVGSIPFQGNTWFEVAEQQLHSPLPELPNHLPEWFRRFVRRCTEKRREERYPDAAALEFYLNPSVTLKELRRRSSRTPRRAALFVCTSLCILACGGLLVAAGIFAGVIPKSMVPSFVERLSTIAAGSHQSASPLATAGATTRPSTSFGTSESVRSTSNGQEHAPMPPPNGDQHHTPDAAAARQMYLCQKEGRTVFTNDPPKGWRCLAAK